MDDSSSVVAEDDQGVEKPKRRGCNNEHVDRRNLGQMVVQEATPGRGGDFGPPRQVSPDRGLADLDAELEQFVMNAGCAPEGISYAQVDQFARAFHCRRFSSVLAHAIQAEATAPPARHLLYRMLAYRLQRRSERWTAQSDRTESPAHFSVNWEYCRRRAETFGMVDRRNIKFRTQRFFA